MNNLLTLFVTLLCFTSTTWAQHTIPQPGKPGAALRNNTGICPKDSTLITDAQGQVEERVLYVYGTHSETRFRYRRANTGAPLTLFSVDSFQYNADQQLIFEQSTGQLLGANGQTIPYLDRQFFYAPCPPGVACVADSVVAFTAQFPLQDLKPSFKTVRQYDPEGRLLIATQYTPTNDFTGFVPSTKDEYTYELGSGRLAEVLQSIYTGGDTAWVLSIKKTYQYNAAGELLRILEIYPDGIPFARSLFSNNTDLNYQQTEFSYWNLGGAFWNQPFTITRAYQDGSDRPLAEVLEVNAFSLQGTDSTHFEYLAGGDCLQKIKQYSGSGSSLSFVRQTEHFYSVSSAQEPLADVFFSVFPNPAQQELILTGAEGGLVRILSQDGKTVYQQRAFSEQERIVLPVLAPGAYYLQVSRNAQSATRPLLIRD